MTEDEAVRTWGERWLASMGDVTPAFAEQLGRGSYYVSRGAVRQLELTAGHVAATFQYARSRPQSLVIRVEPLGDEAWERLVGVLAEELRFSAQLYEGDLPPELGPVLDEAGVDLVPSRDEVTETCICTDEDDPCIHLAAAHHALARRFDDDPFRLLELRGRDRATLLASIRARRSGTDLRTAARSPHALPFEEIGVTDHRLARADLEAVTVHPHRVEDPAWLFDHLGDPPGVDDTVPLQRLIGRAADTAWRLAAGEGADVADDEVLLAELRSKRMASAAALADAVGWDPEVAREALDRLFDEGQVMRMGSGADAKYRAAS